MNHIATNQSQTAVPSLPDSLNSLLKAETIDWEQSYEFESEGLARHVKTGVYTNNVLPVPQVDRSIAMQACEALDEVLKPMTKQDFSVLVYRLSLHCGLKKMTESESRLYADDLWNDVQDYPLQLLEIACEKWRKSTDKRTQYMPSSGDLISLMYEENAKLKKLRKRAYKLAGVPLMRECPKKTSEVIARMIEGMGA